MSEAIKFKRRTPQKYIGKLGSGLLSDNVKSSEKGKVDCYGVFTIMYAWGYPCSRTWKATITIFELPKGKTSITVNLMKGNKIIKALANVTIETDEPNSVIVVPIPMKYRFEKHGLYNLEFSLKDNKNKLRLPFEVRTNEWTQFTEKEIEFAKGNSSIPQSIRANVHCDKCEHAYIFEETFLPELELKGGILRFPESGKFECEECDHAIELRDIQGQLRASLKEIITKEISK